MNGWLEFEEKRSLFLACLRAARFYPFSVLALLLFLKAPPANAQQITPVPPFIGTHSETWERFGVNEIPSGTSILGSIATISGDRMETAHSFQMCTVIGMPSDGTILMDSDRPTGPVIISFSQLVSAFGAYWGSGVGCEAFGFPDAPIILTFRDVNGNVIGTDSFFYTGDGALTWHGYQFGTPVKTITRTAGDGVEGFAIDRLRATVAGAAPPPAVLGDFNSDAHPDYLLYNAGTRRTVVWYMHNNAHVASNNAPTLPSGWSVVAVEDFNGDGHPDYLLYNSTTHDTVVWYLVGATFLASNHGPHIPSGWQVVATSDFNGDSNPDLVLYNSSTRQTSIWHMNNNVRVGGATGPTLPSGWSLVAAVDFDADSDPDYLLFRPSTGQSVIWYMSGATHTSSRSGPTIVSGHELVGAADFDGNGSPDYVLYKSTTGQTAIWYLNDNLLITHASGPILPAGWSLVAP